MGWDQDFFNATDERIATLARVIVRYRPDVILTHYPVGPYLIDSNAFAGIYATRAMHEATTLIPQVDGVEPHYTKELFFFLMDQSMDTRSNIDTPGIVADFFVDTTAVIARKVQAFDQYVSQGYEGQFARKVVEARDGRHGMHAEASYAEPFLHSRSATLRRAADHPAAARQRLRRQQPAGRPAARPRRPVRHAAGGLSHPSLTRPLDLGESR